MSTTKGTVNQEESKEECDADGDIRMLSAATYALVMIGLGLPLWWKMTEVYRVPLPYSEIGTFDDLPLMQCVKVSVVTMDKLRGDSIAEAIQRSFQNSKIVKFNISTRTVTFGERKALGQSHSLQDLENSYVSSKTVGVGMLQLLEVPGLARLSKSSIVVGKQRTVYFSSDTDGLKLADVIRRSLVSEDSLARTVGSFIDPTLTRHDAAGWRRMPPAPGYTVLVTLVNPQPETVTIHWDIPSAIEDYLDPFLKQMSLTTSFSVNSQILHLTTLAARPEEVSGTGVNGKSWILSEDVLPHVITPLESKLASHVSSWPGINFVIYVPPCDRAPLFIVKSKEKVKSQGLEGQILPANALLSPRWGGILVANPSPGDCHPAADNKTMKAVVHLSSEEIMSVIISQLRLLLGIETPEEMTGVTYSSGKSLLGWEFDRILRIRAAEQLMSARSTLQSLARLLGEISNIVIPDHVGDDIVKATEDIKAATKLLAEGELEDGFQYSREAFLAAERAFSDPSLLALLYFPDDQKYAVYIPLFLPVGIPVVFSLRNIIKWLRKTLSSKKEKLE